jgi:hypothetical protein
LFAASWSWWHAAPPSGTPSQGRSRAATAPVHTAIVATTSFPLGLNGLGTVQATNTVTVRSAVDGQIERGGFEEGQMIKEGQLLVQIDPAPFQSAEIAAVAKLLNQALTFRTTPEIYICLDRLSTYPTAFAPRTPPPGNPCSGAWQRNSTPRLARLNASLKNMPKDQHSARRRAHKIAAGAKIIAFTRRARGYNEPWPEVTDPLRHLEK